jgi:hypothetical protein
LSFDVVMIEIQENREEIKIFMESRGFERVYELPGDDVYKFASRPSQLSPVAKGNGTYNLVNANGVSKINGEPDWSQGGQPEFVDRVLSQKRGGFFVEVGGLDGEEFSNSLFFEMNREYDGLLIEANPYTFKQMLKTDRKCYMAHACISRDLSHMDFKIAGAVTSAVQTMSEDHDERIGRDIPVYADLKTWEGSGAEVTTTCTTLNALMDDIGRKHIDFFSLDVEGAELHILHSIDFSTLSFDVVMIEIQENREEIKIFMESRGFERVYELPGDDVYKFAQD